MVPPEAKTLFFRLMFQSKPLFAERFMAIVPVHPGVSRADHFFVDDSPVFKVQQGNASAILVCFANINGHGPITQKRLGKGSCFLATLLFKLGSVNTVKPEPFDFSTVPPHFQGITIRYRDHHYLAGGLARTRTCAGAHAGKITDEIADILKGERACHKA